MSHMLMDRLSEALGKKEPIIKVRGEVSGLRWAEVKIINFNGGSIGLGTPLNCVTLGAQFLVSGAPFLPMDGRIDNAHGFLHEHSGAWVILMEDKTISGALLKLFGEDYKTFENKVSGLGSVF